MRVPRKKIFRTHSLLLTWNRTELPCQTSFFFSLPLLLSSSSLACWLAAQIALQLGFCPRRALTGSCLSQHDLASKKNVIKYRRGFRGRPFCAGGGNYDVTPLHIFAPFSTLRIVVCNPQNTCDFVPAATGFSDIVLAFRTVARHVGTI
jgi:hypothetical protein